MAKARQGRAAEGPADASARPPSTRSALWHRAMAVPARGSFIARGAGAGVGGGFRVLAEIRRTRLFPDLRQRQPAIDEVVTVAQGDAVSGKGFVHRARGGGGVWRRFQASCSSQSCSSRTERATNKGASVWNASGPWAP